MKREYEVRVWVDDDVVTVTFQSVKNAWKLFYSASRKGYKTGLGLWIGSQFQCLGQSQRKEPWLRLQNNDGYCEIRRDMKKRENTLWHLASEKHLGIRPIYKLLGLE